MSRTLSCRALDNICDVQWRQRSHSSSSVASAVGVVEVAPTSRVGVVATIFPWRSLLFQALFVATRLRLVWDVFVIGECSSWGDDLKEEYRLVSVVMEAYHRDVYLSTHSLTHPLIHVNFDRISSSIAQAHNSSLVLKFLVVCCCQINVS